jgi:hypothetical protein
MTRGDVLRYNLAFALSRALRHDRHATAEPDRKRPLAADTAPAPGAAAVAVSPSTVQVVPDRTARIGSNMLNLRKARPPRANGVKSLGDRVSGNATWPNSRSRRSTSTNPPRPTNERQQVKPLALETRPPGRDGCSSARRSGICFGRFHPFAHRCAFSASA